MSRHRRKRSDEVVDAAARRRQAKTAHPHGHKRDGDAGAKPMLGAAIRLRRATGTPLLVFTVLGVLTFVGLARVHMRTRVLELGEEISELTEERARLLDRKRRLQTERAYLRHPDRIRTHANVELGMTPVPPDRIQRIELREQQADQKRKAKDPK